MALSETKALGNFSLNQAFQHIEVYSKLLKTELGHAMLVEQRSKLLDAAKKLVDAFVTRLDFGRRNGRQLLPDVLKSRPDDVCSALLLCVRLSFRLEYKPGGTAAEGPVCGTSGWAKIPEVLLLYFTPKAEELEGRPGPGIFVVRSFKIVLVLVQLCLCWIDVLSHLFHFYHWCSFVFLFVVSLDHVTVSYLRVARRVVRSHTVVLVWNCIEYILHLLSHMTSSQAIILC